MRDVFDGAAAGERSPRGDSELRRFRSFIVHRASYRLEYLALNFFGDALSRYLTVHGACPLLSQLVKDLGALQLLQLD